MQADPEQLDGLFGVLGEELRAELERNLKERGERACEDVDMMVASALRQLPPTWRAMPARDAFRMLLRGSASGATCGTHTAEEVDKCTQTEASQLNGGHSHAAGSFSSPRCTSSRGVSPRPGNFTAGVVPSGGHSGAVSATSSTGRAVTAPPMRPGITLCDASKSLRALSPPAGFPSGAQHPAPENSSACNVGVAAQKWQRPGRGEARRQQAELEARRRAAEENISRTERLHRELTDSLQRWESLDEEERQVKLRWIHSNAEDLLSKSSNTLTSIPDETEGALHRGSLAVAAGGPAGGA